MSRNVCENCLQRSALQHFVEAHPIVMRKLARFAYLMLGRQLEVLSAVQQRGAITSRIRTRNTRPAESGNRKGLTGNCDHQPATEQEKVPAEVPMQKSYCVGWCRVFRFACLALNEGT